ncbi:MAG: sugar ABC transporter ATP-binding protein [Planctomycetaceae bacterium]|nr:sugar ABC transporter ATP-binding protein [Planctomycetaceae bacterium]
MTSTSIISIQSVTKRYPGVVALSNVSIDIRAGELHSICGENGAGKSTLMKILSGVITDYEGCISIGDQPIQFRGTRDAESKGISIIHQELNLVEELSAAANVFLGREHTSSLGLLNHKSMNDETRSLLKRLECNVHPQAQAGSLRVGDQQLLEIAKALSLSSDILIMDEPTSALTESEVERLYRVIDKLRSDGVTILYISHKMDEVFRLSDRITILRDGELVKTLDRGATSPREVTNLMVGRDIDEMNLGDPRNPGDVILEVRSLSLPWPGHARSWRLKDISFELRQGEILGIAGLMGAGRTELLECLFGATDQIPSGQVFVDDRQVRFRNPNEAKRAGVAMVTEDRKRLGLFAQMCVRENISICTLEETVNSGVVRRARESQLVNEMINRLSVKTAGAESEITSLSGGNQQKTIIGRWLLTRPKILLLDDPTRGVDVGAKSELYRLMNQLCNEGIAIILTSSELPELLTVCDRVLVLAEGHLTAEFDRAEASEQKIMEAATKSATG